MNSRRRREGCLLIDHRAGVGISRDEAQACGAIPVPSGTMVEAPTYNCSHCQRLVVMNPNRRRERAYCPKCDRHICDGCELIRVSSGGDCVPYKRVIEKIQEAAVRAGAG